MLSDALDSDRAHFARANGDGQLVHRHLVSDVVAVQQECVRPTVPKCPSRRGGNLAHVRGPPHCVVHLEVDLAPVVVELCTGIPVEGRMVLRKRLPLGGEWSATSSSSLGR